VSASNKLGENGVMQSFVKTRASVSLLVELIGKKMVIISFEVTSSVALPLFAMYQLFSLGGVIVGDDVGAVVGAIDDEDVGEVVGEDVGAIDGEDVGKDVGEDVSEDVGENVGAIDGKVVGEDVGEVVGEDSMDGCKRVLGLSEGSNDSEGGDDGFALGVVVGGVDGR